MEHPIESARRSDTVVWHCDADAFFAACHVAVDPGLGGRPLIVGGDPATRHGIVLTASYEARRYGVRTAMPLGQALRLCPEATVLRPDGALYEAMSRRLNAIWARYSPSVEPRSIDEGWLDVGGGALWPFGMDPVRGARALQTEIWDTLRISVSIGISRNKMLAKQASRLEKPRGITVLWPEQVGEKLWPLPVEALYGVGPKTAVRLRAEGLATVGDVAHTSADRLHRILGASGATIWARAWGADATPVTPPTPGDELTLSVERTLPYDVASPAAARPYLVNLADLLSARLRRHERLGQTVVLKYKTAAFVLHTRQTTLATPTRDAERLFRAGWALFLHRPHPEPVRLLGLGVGNLAAGACDLFADPRREALEHAIDRIRLRYGVDAIGPLGGRVKSDATPTTFRRPPGR
jgi:DNA polymerase-4